MGDSKVAAFAIAVISAVLVIIAGKSCADDINETNKRNAAKNKGSQSVVIETNNNIPPVPDGYQEEPSPIEPTEAIEYVTVTDIYGRVSEVPVTEPVTEEEPATEGPTVTKSMLEEYNDAHTTPADESSEIIEQAPVEPVTTDPIQIPTKIVIEIG